MLIVKVLGGLGNQMYQYALYRALLLKGFEVKLDLSAFNTYKLHNGFELESVFSLPSLICATQKEIEKYSDQSNTIFSRIQRKLFGLNKSHVKEELYSEVRLDKMKHVYLDGYWQSDLYFAEIAEEIRSDFIFSNSLSERNIEISEKIKISNSVGIHIRRGDYITNQHAYNEYGRICDLAYYTEAIELIQLQINTPHFFVFSNDIEWVKHNVNFSYPVDFISWNLAKESFVDMELMSLCKHNIIANSSFSWWGAWLNNNKDKVVLAPSRWKAGPDINKKRTPDEWQTVEVLLNEPIYN
ncbi:MAG: hypothetical protein ACI9YH_001406 [Colwellia sp.]|jgi:hypothetical protein